MRKRLQTKNVSIGEDTGDPGNVMKTEMERRDVVIDVHGHQKKGSHPEKRENRPEKKGNLHTKTVNLGERGSRLKTGRRDLDIVVVTLLQRGIMR